MKSRVIIIFLSLSLSFSVAFVRAQGDADSAIVDNPRTISLGWYAQQRYIVDKSLNPAVTIPQRRAMLDEMAQHGFDYVMPYSIWARFTLPETEDDDWVLGYLDDAQARGVKVMVDMHPSPDDDHALITHRANLVKDHPALYGYYLDEEMISRNIPAATVIAKYNAIKAVDPNHPIIINFIRPIPMAYALGYFSAGDIISRQLYGSADMLTVPFDVAAAENAGKRYVAVVKAYDHDGKLPTPAEFRYSVFAPVSMGASGIIPFIFEGSPVGQNTPAVRESVYYAATDQLRAITPVLLKQSEVPKASLTGSAYITWLFAGERDDAVLVAVNNSGASMSGIDFKLTGLDPSISTAKVLGEDRTIALDGNSHFVDDFDRLGVHIYRFIPKRTSMTVIQTEYVVLAMTVIGIGLFLLALRNKRVKCCNPE